MLIKSNFPLDQTTNSGLTAVALAAKKGHLQIIKALKFCGGDINKCSKEGIGALYMAIINDHE
jgi:ankyrin repeat protein